jgi:hypothetical protein
LANTGIDHKVNLKTKVPLFTMGGMFGVVLVLLSRECKPTFFFLSSKMVSNFTFHQDYAMTQIGKLVGLSPNKAPTTNGCCCLHYHWSSISPYSPLVLQRL